MADTKNDQQNRKYRQKQVRTGDTPLSAVADQAGSSPNNNQSKKDVPEKYKYMDEP